MATNTKDQEKKEEEAAFLREQTKKAPEPLIPEIKPEVLIQITEKEKVPEKVLETVEKKELAEKVEAPQIAPQVSAPSAQVSAPKSEILVNIERVLEEDLSEMYTKMSPQEQLAFRMKGEETAIKIEKLFHEARATVRKILKLIREWLKMIHGANKYFLEQAAKIKTDRLMKLKK
jgi:glutaredoxin 2